MISVAEALKDKSLWADGFQTCGDKHPVRIYCTDAGGEYPVHAAYQENSGEWYTFTLTADGLVLSRHHGRGRLDIELRPRKQKGWVNIYDDPPTTNLVWQIYPTKQEAEEGKYPRYKRLACIEIEFTEGDGL